MNDIYLPEEQQTPPAKRRLPKPGKKGRFLAITAAAAVLAAAVVPRVLNRGGGAAAIPYQLAQAERRDLSVSVSGSATLEPADSYQVTTLISGAILDAPFEEGDLVDQGALLYAMDHSEAQDSVNRANLSQKQAQVSYQQAKEALHPTAPISGTINEVFVHMDHSEAQDSVNRANLSQKQAQVSYQQAKEALHPTAPISGTINEVFVHDGDSVSAGTALAYITTNTDLTIDFLFPYAEPSAFYVGQAATVYIGDFEAPVQGTVASVSDATTITSNGIDFLFPYAEPSAFYVGQAATVYIGDFEAPVQGTVASVSDATTITSNGKISSSVRVKLNNPGVVSETYTASAVIGTYTSYGASHITMPNSTTVYASGSGTVTGFQKLAGSAVTKGEVLCTVESEAIRAQIENARLSMESARLSAGTAADHLEDYTITSPISGTVIEKTFKAGDKVDGVASGLSMESARLSAGTAADHLEDYTITSPISGTVIEKTFKAGDKVDGVASGTLAVIYDLSCLKMEMNVSELDIGKVQVGQTVELTASALPGEVFTGTVEKVSINGTTTKGFTNYPVTVTVEEYGQLKPGMNVSATILCDTAENALCVPVDAVARGNTVLVAGPDALAEDGTVADPALLEERQVVLGRSDADYIEITSGLADGETVAFLAQSPEEGG